MAHLWATQGPASTADDRGHALGGMVRVARLFTPPPTGPDMNTAPLIAAEALWLDEYRRADAELDLRVALRSLVLRPRAAAGWGDAMPLASLLALGGPRGFPGLRTGERRGDRVASVTLAALYPLGGPFYARGDVGGGRTSLSRARQPGLSGAASGWVSGSELGIAVTTPMGPFLIGYGRASTGRPIVKVRLGE
jgi:hypothetical protein